MWAKSDKRQVCAFCSIGTNHTTYPSCTQSNCSDSGSNAALFFLQNFEVYVHYSSFFVSTKSTHFALIALYLMLSHSPFVCYPLFAQQGSETLGFYFLFPILFVNFTLSNVHRYLKFSTLYVPVWSSYFLFDLFPIVHLLHQSYFFLGLYPLVLEAMIWTQWPWRDKPISWLISSVCFS